MKKFLNVLGMIFIGAFVAVFVFNILMFAATDNTIYGIWAIILALTIRVSGNIEITVKER